MPDQQPALCMCVCVLALENELGKNAFKFSDYLKQRSKGLETDTFCISGEIQINYKNREINSSGSCDCTC